MHRIFQKSMRGGSISTKNLTSILQFTRYNKFVTIASSSTFLEKTMPHRKFSSTVQFKLADIGEGIAEVELLQWFVKEGDVVKSFDKICEVQSDKATVEITSRYDGSILKLHHQVGDIMKVGHPIVDISNDSIVLDKLDNQNKADSPKPSNSNTNASYTTNNSNSNSTKFDSNSTILTTPAVRKIAKENNIDLSKLQGTGPKGRITKEDVLSTISNGFVSSNQTMGYRTPTLENKSIPSPVISNSPNKGTVPIKGIQRMMYKSMTSSKQIPHLTLTDEIQMDNLIKARSELKSWTESKGIKLTYLPFFIKAASLALHKYPVVNSSISADEESIIYHENHNIGIAMDTPKGLLVPVIKSVQNKSVASIALELNQLQAIAAQGKLSEIHLSDVTFTLSNIGSITGTHAVPVIVPPQVAIGAIGKFQTLPKYMIEGKPATLSQIYDGLESSSLKIEPSTFMNISWSADHRVIDGATIAKFSKLWGSYIEIPSKMIFDLR